MSDRGASGDDHWGSDLLTENSRTRNRYVAAVPSLAAFLLAAQVAQQCLVTPEKSLLNFFNRIICFQDSSGRSLSSRRCSAEWLAIWTGFVDNSAAAESDGYFSVYHDFSH